MTTTATIDETGQSAYGVKMDGACPLWTGSLPYRQRGKRYSSTNARQLRGATGLYMADLERKTLNEWREERGLSVDALAAKAEFDPFVVQNWLYKGRTPRVPAALALAAALRVDVTQIIWGRSEKKTLEEKTAGLPPMPKSPSFTPTVKATLVSDEQMAVAQQWMAADVSKTDIAEAMGVSRQTFYLALKRFEEQHSAPAPKKAKTRKAPKV